MEESTTKKYKPLEDEVLNIQGVGIPNLSSKKEKRHGDVCLYKRSDDVYEVFIVQKREATKIFDKNYPPMELYPSNESFGTTAWCYTDISLAEKRFNKLKGN